MALRPKFSIITVTYNASSVIEPTLQSVAAQSYKNYEYLLIDGVSTDDTVSKAVATGMEFAHIVSEGDSGLYDAMNKGIALATGSLCPRHAGAYGGCHRGYAVAALRHIWRNGRG